MPFVIGDVSGEVRVAAVHEYRLPPVCGLVPAGVATMPGAVAAEADVSEISFR